MDNPTKLATVSKVVTDLTVTSTANTNNIAIPNPVSNGKVALNVYQIYPKKLVYPLSGFTNVTTENQIIVGANNLTTTVNAYELNLDASVQMVASGTALNRSKFNIEYVSYSGQFISLSVDGELTISPGYTIPNCKNVNRVVVSDGYTVPDLTLYTRSVYQSVFRSSINSYWCGVGIITVPNGYIGIISDIYFYSAVLGDFKMYVRDIQNNIKTIQTFNNMALFQQRYNYMGSFNYPLYPGESVYFASGANNMGSTHVHAIVTMTAV